jgi:hypothetical protein
MDKDVAAAANASHSACRVLLLSTVALIGPSDSDMQKLAKHCLQFKMG